MYRARHVSGRRPFGTISLLVALAMVVAAFIAVPLVGAGEAEGPSKVWICHFEDNHVNPNTSGQFAWPDGDWVLNYRVDMPRQNQINYCEVQRGGELLIVSVNSAKGHRLQLTERISDYPDGFKG